MCMPGTLLVSSCQEFLTIQFLYGLARSEGRGVRKTRTSKAQTSDPEKLTPPGRLENTDPQLNIFQMSILLSTFNFQLWIISERKKGGFVILAPWHYIVYTIEMNKQVSCFQIWIWSGMISQSDSGWLWHYPFLQGMTGHFKTSASFSVCWITYEKFPTTYMHIWGDLENICVLEIILLC